MNNSEIVFLTPSQLKDLNIGFPLKGAFKEDEFSDTFPFILSELKSIAKENIIGKNNGSEISISVENSCCKAFICISVNGKLCKLQSEEWMINNNFHGLPVETQVKVFQRLISQGQITLDDLATEDIDDSVYKQLVVNDLCGEELYQEKIKELDKIWEEQKNNKTFTKLRKTLSSENL